MLRLRVTPAQGDKFDLPLLDDEVVIGRSSECNLTIRDRFMSRRHARLFQQDGRWWLEDLDSSNGTLVNGTKVTESTPVGPGDEIALSGSTVRIEDTSAAALATETSSEQTIFRPAAELLESQVAAAPEDAEPLDHLRSYAERLKMINEVHQILARSTSLDELLEAILDRAFHLLEAEEGVIVLRQPDGGYRRAARRAAPGYEEEHPLSETLVHEVVEKGLAALVLDVAQDARFAEAESIIASGMRSLVAAPLADSEGALGMIALNSRLHRHQFTEADMELLTSVAAAAALRVRNLGLTEEAAERRRLEKEVNLARRVQVNLLPERLPDLEGYDIHGGTVPSQGVSGDFYEIVPRGDDGECVILVADVSGKGIGASILTASLEALLAGPLEAGLTPGEICAEVSGRLFDRTLAAKYATAVLAVLSPASGHLSYTSAGHNPGLVVRGDGSVEEFKTCGLPIGLLPGAEYSTEQLDLLPGDLLVLYSDGITEAADPDDEEFGLERLGAVCIERRDTPVADIADSISQALDEFVRGVPFADDRTLVLVRRQALTGHRRTP